MPLFITGRLTLGVVDDAFLTIGVAVVRLVDVVDDGVGILDRSGVRFNVDLDFLSTTLGGWLSCSTLTADSLPTPPSFLLFYFVQGDKSKRKLVCVSRGSSDRFANIYIQLKVTNTRGKNVYKGKECVAGSMGTKQAIC